MKVWVPVLAAVLAAVIGLAAGIGGAWIGGSVANEGQQKQFKNQRLAHAQDLLEAEYSNFLGAAQAVVTDRNLARQATKIGDTAQAARNHAKEEVDFVRFRAADAQVRLVASDDVRRDAAVVRDALAGGTGTLHWVTARNAFIGDARRDIKTAGGLSP